MVFSAIFKNIPLVHIVAGGNLGQRRGKTLTMLDDESTLDVELTGLPKRH